MSSNSFHLKNFIQLLFLKLLSDAMDKYGTDKPDLRNPLIIKDITKIFMRTDVKFEIFKNLVKNGAKVKAIVTKIQKTNLEVFSIVLTGKRKNKDLQG